MPQLLLRGRLLGCKAVRINRSLSVVPHRYYASQSGVHQQVSATAAMDGCPLNRTTAKSIDEMPGPKRFPILGSTLSMIADKDFKRTKLDAYWKKLKDEYGDIVRLDFPGIGPTVMVFHPDDVQKLARVTMNNPVRLGANTFKKIREEAMDNYFEKKPGIVASNGEEWWRVRSRVQTPMMKPRNVTAYLTQMDEVALNFLDIMAGFQKNLGEMPEDFQIELYKWSLESVCLVALNRRLGCLSPNLPADSEQMTLIKAANNMLEGLNKTEFGPQLFRYFPTPAYIQVKNSHNAFLKIADENIRKTEAELLAKEPNSDDDMTLMETLLMVPGLKRKDVVTLIIDMMFAGIDTTSNTVAFTLYLLARNPRVQLKLQKEIDTVLGDHKGPLTPKHLGQLSYLKAVVKESLRIFPLGLGTMRTIPEDTVFAGHLVPKGYNVIAGLQFMADDERFFNKAKEFIPERWGRDKPEGDFHPFANQPFGIGARMCIGRRIAEQEIYTLLTRLMQRFTIDYKYQDMGFFTRLINVPSEPLRFNITERKQQ